MRNFLLTLLIGITVATIVATGPAAAVPVASHAISPPQNVVPAPLFTMAPVVSSLTLEADHTGSLSCPNEYKLKATAAGTAGAKFAYSVDTDFNGSTYHQVVGEAFTMPAAGTVDIHFKADVPQLGGNNNDVKIMVTPVGGTMKSATFAVTCAGISMSGFTFVNEPPAGGLWRPTPGIHYALEQLQGQVRLQLPGQATGAPDCGFNLIVKSPTGQTLSWQYNGPGPMSQANGQYFVTDTVNFLPPTSGVYHMTAVGQSHASGQPACVNGGNLGTIDFAIFPPTAWVTGLHLQGFGYYFHGGTSSDAWSGQWCQNCNSIFSPGHSEGFMAVAPEIQGATLAAFARAPGYAGQCSYNVTFNGGSFDGNNTMNLGQAKETVFYNGQPAVPASQPTLFNGYNPFWSEWNGNTNTAQVTISASNNDPLIPPCNIPGGSITKTITFTNNANAAVVNR
jgi:hypothetical protein